MHVRSSGNICEIFAIGILKIFIKLIDFHPKEFYRNLILKNLNLFQTVKDD